MTSPDVTLLQSVTDCYRPKLEVCNTHKASKYKGLSPFCYRVTDLSAILFIYYYLYIIFIYILKSFQNRGKVCNSVTKTRKAL